MPQALFLALIIGAAAPSLEPIRPDTGEAGGGRRVEGGGGAVVSEVLGSSRVAAAPLPPPASLDTTRRRRAVTVSPWYERRAMAHRVTALVVPALFAYQYYQGSRLLDNEGEARSAHRAGRTAIVGAFSVNAVTGLWNLWASRGTPGGTARVLHGASMIGAAAGFAVAGTRLVDDMRSAQSLEELTDARHRHRNVALGSMAVTLVSGTAMWLTNR